MATWTATASFLRDYRSLSADQKKRFKSALRKFVKDLNAGAFRKSLRVRGVEGGEGVFEMTWDRDGRATFQYGREVRSGQPHIVWRRCGRHEILESP